MNRVFPRGDFPIVDPRHKSYMRVKQTPPIKVPIQIDREEIAEFITTTDRRSV